ncbi:hypothetical protein [Erythrobacter sp. HL-111]|uniref:hypothetical protein n=1 Tax=Erythrobacter sp. HL-111 TaxID=1798193 RepID=UPI0006D9EB02|nr:hypothetical protein [Erythrobacter sp. HL-111]KPP96237.1 MAG: Thyroglobulin type-1 repeat [Erythrobacteraceae bacterium HL-111]SDR76852.1 hypothetical protein SAMN04515621_0313 [Erythrobacter sp. HL-111]
MTRHSPIRFAAALVAALALVLSGCFVAPGRFDSTLVLNGDDTFTFTYDGEIFFLGLSSLSQMGAAAESFEPKCTVEGSFEERECTPAEVAGQRAEWDAGADRRAAEAKEKAQQMAAVMGGIDPSDPEAAQELAALLMRHEGWERVVPKGDGVFEVGYRIDGSLGHDFLFPVIEDFPPSGPFVQVILRKDDVVRINAPAFAAQNDNPLGGMMGGMMGNMGALAGLAALGDEENGGEGQQMPDIPQVEGTFTLVLKGGMRILANNTDEGPDATPTGEVLSWEISPRTRAAPTALIDLAP